MLHVHTMVPTYWSIDNLRYDKKKYMYHWADLGQFAMYYHNSIRSY